MVIKVKINIDYARAHYRQLNSAARKASFGTCVHAHAYRVRVQSAVLVAHGAREVVSIASSFHSYWLHENCSVSPATTTNTSTAILKKYTRYSKLALIAPCHA